ncbi:MAG: polyprenyl synthetase family protein [Lentisphaeria bacterium]|nr:polyprenyl synthetase family protein [Lentisphaeria bacterium]NQZ68661.1 polyprenyl synthetase family protein [Lentisphaeria bacterium]
MNEELKAISSDVHDHIMNHAAFNSLRPASLKEATLAYLDRGGKTIRPALFFWSAALFQDDFKPMNVAAAIELYHTWTLVHDDIIDQDDTRRGGPSAHKLIEDKYDNEHYGKSIAILAGDVQHSLVQTFIIDETLISDNAKLLLLKRINELGLGLVIGESIDVDFELRHPDSISSDEIEEMIKLKTANLLRFSAEAGAICFHESLTHADVAALGDCAEALGMAFQLQDDWLGLFADEEKLGKPVGSDIIQGKCTWIFAKALELTNDAQKETLLKYHGNKSCSQGNLQEVNEIIRSCGAEAALNTKAAEYQKQAIDCLDTLPDKESKKQISELIDFVLNREH